MCKDCGCGGGHAHSHSHAHVRADGTVYTHTHEEAPHDHAKPSVTVKLEQAILSANDAAAAANRVWLAAKGIVALNLISSPGSGKTRLLEKTLEYLSEKGIPCAVLVGDQYGEADALRLKRFASSVTQIQTGERCHLNAEEIMTELPRSVPEGTRILFIENVGNLVCPVAFDLGENAKIALLSTPEGEEKPVKYPALFASSSLVVLTKMDIAEVLHWNLEECTDNIRKVNPAAEILPLSAQTGEGMQKWFDYLIQYMKKGENQ